MPLELAAHRATILPQFALVAVELLWLPQAAAAAYVLSALAEGKAAMIWQAVALFAIVGMMRPLIAHAGRVRLDNLAEAEIARLRKTVLGFEVQPYENVR